MERGTSWFGTLSSAWSTSDRPLAEGEIEVPLTAQPLRRCGWRRHGAARAPAVLPTNTRSQRGSTVRPASGSTSWRTVVWDLYCGVGGFALNVTAPGDACSASRWASRRSRPGVGARAARMWAFGRDATSVGGLAAPDPVVVNPPRRGIGPELAAARRPRCGPSSTRAATSNRSPATWRDAVAQPGTGRVFDMFPQTPTTRSWCCSRARPTEPRGCRHLSQRQAGSKGR